MLRVVIKNKRQLKKMLSESHYCLDGADILIYIGPAKCLTVTPSEVYAIGKAYRVDGWGVHKRFIRKVIRK